MNKQQEQRLQEAQENFGHLYAIFHGGRYPHKSLFKELLNLRDSEGKHIIGVIDSDQMMVCANYARHKYDGWRKVILPE